MEIIIIIINNNNNNNDNNNNNNNKQPQQQWSHSPVCHFQMKTSVPDAPITLSRTVSA
jgi:hypothetical protein